MYEPPSGFKQPAPRAGKSRRSRHRFRVGQRVWYQNYGRRNDGTIEALKPELKVRYNWTDGQEYIDTGAQKSDLVPNYDDDL